MKHSILLLIICALIGCTKDKPNDNNDDTCHSDTIAFEVLANSSVEDSVTIGYTIFKQEGDCYTRTGTNTIKIKQGVKWTDQNILKYKSSDQNIVVRVGIVKGQVNNTSLRLYVNGTLEGEENKITGNIGGGTGTNMQVFINHTINP